MSDVKFTVFSYQPFIDLNIFQYGHQKCEPLHSFGPAKRNHYLFHYVLSGKGSLTATDSNGIDQEYEIGPNQGFLITPGQITTYTADNEDPWEYAWIEFDGLIVHEVLMNSGLSIDKPIYNTANTLLSDKVRELLLQLASHSEEESVYSKIGQLYLLIDCIVDTNNSKNYSQNEKLGEYYIRQVSKYIEENYKRNISIKEIADYLRISRGYLNKIFKRYTGKSPKEFLTSYRMAKAVQLLKTTQIPIGKVSEQVGYPNQLHFSRAFKDYFGVSPKLWRQMNK